jgi:hypothetical protein
MPDASANAATVAGIDSNSDGIRDDVERRLASEFGADVAALPVAREHAKRLQAAIATPTSQTREAYINYSRCVSNKVVLARLSAQTRATVDTDARRSAYRTVLAGAFVNLEGC